MARLTLREKYDSYHRRATINWAYGFGERALSWKKWLDYQAKNGDAATRAQARKELKNQNNKE